MRLLPALFALSALLAGCSTSPCAHLTEALCTAQGEDNALCQARRASTEERTRLADLQCKRALFLYQSEAGGEAR